MSIFKNMGNPFNPRTGDSSFRAKNSDFFALGDAFLSTRDTKRFKDVLGKEGEQNPGNSA